MTMLAGQIVVITKNPGWYGRLVQWFTQSPAYHCGPAISETQFMSAEAGGVVKRNIADFQGVYITDEDLEPEQVEAAVKFALAQEGKPYAYWDIVLLVIGRWMGKDAPDVIVDRVMDGHQYFCSELSEATMDAAGHTMFPGKHACMVIPKDFYDRIRGVA